MFYYYYFFAYLIVHLYPKSKAITLQLVLVIQRLHDFQRSCAVVISYHSKFIGTVTAVLDYLKYIVNYFSIQYTELSAN